MTSSSVLLRGRRRPAIEKEAKSQMVERFWGSALVISIGIRCVAPSGKGTSFKQALFNAKYPSIRRRLSFREYYWALLCGMRITNPHYL